MNREKSARIAGLLLIAVMVFGSSLPAQASPASVQITDGSTITSAWVDGVGRSIFVRVGSYDPVAGVGFGMTKIIQKHGISAVTTVQFITGNPNGGIAQGLDRQYTAYANEKVCNSYSCEYTDSVQLTAVFSSIIQSPYYGVVIPTGVIGIKTAYCNNSDASSLCPSWVDASVLNSDAIGSATTKTVLSYSPLAAPKVP